MRRKIVLLHIGFKSELCLRVYATLKLEYMYNKTSISTYLSPYFRVKIN